MTKYKCKIISFSADRNQLWKNCMLKEIIVDRDYIKWGIMMLKIAAWVCTCVYTVALIAFIRKLVITSGRVPAQTRGVSYHLVSPVTIKRLLIIDLPFDKSLFLSHICYIVCTYTRSSLADVYDALYLYISANFKLDIIVLLRYRQFFFFNQLSINRTCKNIL